MELLELLLRLAEVFLVFVDSAVKSHLQYWAQDLHLVIIKTADDNCDTTIYNRFAIINTDSFDGKPIHIQKAETTIYTDSSKTELGVCCVLPRARPSLFVHARYVCMLCMLSFIVNIP